MFARGMYRPRVPAAGGDQLNSRAGTGHIMLSSTPVPPTAAKAGGLTIFDFVVNDIGPWKRVVKGNARKLRSGTLQRDACAPAHRACDDAAWPVRMCAPRVQRCDTVGVHACNGVQRCDTVVRTYASTVQRCGTVCAHMCTEGVWGCDTVDAHVCTESATL